MFNSSYDLCKDQFGFQVIESPPGGDTGEEVSPAAVLHNHIESPASLKNLIQAHYVGVAQLLHAADL